MFRGACTSLTRPLPCLEAECRASRVVLGVRALPEVAELKWGGIEQGKTKVGNLTVSSKSFLSKVDNLGSN